MSEGVILAIIGVLGTILGSFLAYIFGKRKAEAEIEGTEADTTVDLVGATSEVLEIYRQELSTERTLNQELRDRLQEFEKDLDEVSIELKRQRERILKQDKIIKEVVFGISILTKQLKEIGESPRYLPPPELLEIIEEVKNDKN